MHMGLLELLMVVVVVLWLTGTYVVPIGSAVHLLIVVGVTLVLVKVLRGERL